MRNSVGYEVLSTADKVVEAIGLVEKLAIIVPGYASIASPSDLCLSENPTALHSRHLNQVKVLRHWDTVASIAFHKDSIASVHLNRSLFEEEVHWDLLTIMGRHKQLFTLKILAINRRSPSQLDLLR